MSPLHDGRAAPACLYTRNPLIELGKNMKQILAALALALTAMGAQAQMQDGLYGGALVTRATLSAEGQDNASPIALGGRIGKEINKNFAVEARLGAGVASDSVSVSGIDVDVKVKYYTSLFAKGILPLSEAASLYGLVGYSRVKLSADAGGGTVSNSESDVSFGLGADFAGPSGTTISAEWAQLINKDGDKLNGLSVGVTFKF